MIHWHPDPELFSLGPLHIRTYGVLFSLAFLCSFAVMLWIFRREKRSEDVLNRLFLYVFIGVVAGARLGHCLFYAPQFYLHNPLEILRIWEGGLASHGAAIGILIALWAFVRRTPDVPFSWVADHVAVVIPLSAMFVRFGNFFNSEILGRPASLPWSVVFDRIDQVPRHPVQLYEALTYLLLFFIMITVYRRGSYRLQPGKQAGFMVIILFTARFMLEFFKEGQAAHDAYLPITTGQILSLPLIVFGLWLFFRSKSNHSPQNAD
jgi:phosphatidylglycerol---prolipoprotein diacylglyceryl transferase